MTYPQTLLSDLQAQAEALGFSRIGVVHAEPSDHGAALDRWLDEGHHADMAWMADAEARERRSDLRKTMSDVQSVVVVAHPYAAEDAPGMPDDPSRGVVARYARGRDYHRVLKRKLQELGRWLENQIESDVQGRVYVDTGPILERELAARAGLGWFGRNTMLIDPSGGSYFLLGSLLVDVALPVTGDDLVRDHCGTCTSCLDGCPTGALEGRDETGAPILNARRCISYWTIETDASIPLDIREAMGNRIFGCDICQEVCPWNRFADPDGDPAYAARGPGERPTGVQPLPHEEGVTHPGTASPRLIDLFRMTEREWEAWSRAAPLRRSGYVGFRRSVAVALGNWLGSAAGSDSERTDAVELLEAAVEDDASAVVREHAAWALERAPAS